MHPTGFDNLKTVIEGHFYDLDATEELYIMNREDLVDLANLTRTFILTFVSNQIPAHVKLVFNSKEWMNEVVLGHEEPKCSLSFKWFVNLTDLNEEAILEAYQNLSQLFWNCRIKGINKKDVFDSDTMNVLEFNVELLDELHEDDLERIEFLCNNSIQFSHMLGNFISERGSHK